ncbi:MAG: hypothetical protein H7644_13265 [Candidatus Heimdallarchaeota archaeon]|nr:hypothetical protein [Candidatus Heimdallarchaeota archaeon]MCK5144730.1 hypothetical protein [Candidatus Heimdallarchaeota archaeon]
MERQRHILIIQAGSKMLKPIPANSPTEIRFEVDCLCGFRKTIIILLTVEIENYYNGFFHKVEGVLQN